MRRLSYKQVSAEIERVNAEFGTRHAILPLYEYYQLVEYMPAPNETATRQLKSGTLRECYEHWRMIPTPEKPGSAEVRLKEFAAQLREEAAPLNPESQKGNCYLWLADRLDKLREEYERRLTIDQYED